MPSPEKFRRSLVNFHIAEPIIRQIDAGFEDLVDHSPKDAKAAYFKRAVDIMTQSVDAQTFRDVFEWNACCKGGMREKNAKAFAKENAGLSLAEKLDKIKTVPYMGQPTLNEDGTITVLAVQWKNGDTYRCSCANFNGAHYDGSVSKNYCFCCAGHFRHHYEIMLGVPLKTLCIVSSPLDSNGEKPCVIQFALC